MLSLQGAAAVQCLCSPAGRCGLIGLSQFLWSLLMWLLPCSFRHSAKLHSFILTASPPLASALLHSFVSLHSLISLLGAFVFSTHHSCGGSIVPLCSTQLHRPAQKPLIVHSLLSASLPHSVQPLLFPRTRSKTKTPPALPKRQPFAALSSLRAFCFRRPCSTRSGSPTTLGLILHSVALHFAFKPCFPR